MRIVWQWITFPFRMLCYGLVYFYKFAISPLLPKICIYYPSCSTYMLISIKEFGIFGVWRGIKRLCRCVPWKKGGVDLVPMNIRGKKAFIL